MKHSRKAFHFDLDDKRLKSLYPSDSVTGYKRAWNDIRLFMEKNGFEHTQYSGYETVDGMSYYEAYSIFENLQATFPWFVESAQVATVTEVGERHDILTHLLQMKQGEELAPESQQSHSLQKEMFNMRCALQALEDSKILEPPHRDPHDTSR